MTRLLRWGVLVGLWCLPAALWAQQTGSIQGRVTDARTGEPIPGANVVIRGTQIGAATDLNGRYTIARVPVGTHTLEARFVGYRVATRQVTVRAGESVTADFVLEETALQLNEVVVTGAGGPVEKRKLGNTIATINTAQLQTVPAVNFSEILAGREPGVVSLPSGGITGEGARIRIRGSASLSQLNEPIVYIDGVRVDRGGGFSGFVGTGGGGSPSRLDDINPDAIERVEILKGAAAATLYGTEASNGVIQIFTKKGAVGAPRFDFQVQQVISNYPRVFKPMTSWFRTQAQADTVKKYLGGNYRQYDLVSHNFVHDLFETGRGQTYSASISGGATGVTYFINGRWQYEDGPFGGKKIPMPPGYSVRARDIVSRIQTSANINVFPSDKLQLRVTTGYTDFHLETFQNNNNIYGVEPLTMFARLHLIRYNNPTGSPAFASVPEVLQQTVSQDTRHFNGSFGMNWRPLGSLTLDGTFGVDYTNQQDISERPFGWNINNFTSAEIEGARRTGDLNRLHLTLDLKATMINQIGENLESTFLAGLQGFAIRSIERGALGRRFPGPGINVAGGASEKDVYEFFLENKNLGVFAQEQIGFQNFVFLTVGARYDANSAFGSEFKGVLYPKVSLSVVPSDAAFWRPIGPISSLRFRTALGQSGLQPGAFDALTTYVPLASITGPGLAPGNLGNPKLKPEVSTEWEVGLELGLFNDRYALQATYWDRTVKDALVARQFPFTGGFRARQLDNIGKLKGKGVELGLNAFVLNRQDVTVNFFANASYLWERVISLGGAPPIFIAGTYPRYRNFIKEGYAPGAMFGPRLRQVEAGRYPIDTNRDGNPDTQQELLNYFRGLSATSLVNRANVLGASPLADLNGFLLWQANEQGNILENYLGKPQPDWMGSFGVTINFLRSFSLYALFEYKFGNYTVTNLTDAFRRANPLIGMNTPEAAQAERDFATGGLDANNQPKNDPEVRLKAFEQYLKLVDLYPAGAAGANSHERGDFLRWRELSLTYTVSPQFIRQYGLRNMSITVSGRNLALWTKFSGIDPEVNAVGRGSGGTLYQNFLDSVEAFGLPIPRRIQFSLRFGF